MANSATVQARARRRWERYVAAGLGVLLVLGGGYYYWWRQRSAHLGDNPLPPRPSAPPAGAQDNYSLRDVLPHDVLADQRTVRDERRVLRRIVSVSPQASRQQIRATLLQSLQELTLTDNVGTDLAFIWAIPSPRLVTSGAWPGVLSIVSGRLHYVADGKGLTGHHEGGVNSVITELPADGPIPTFQELNLTIDAAAAVASQGGLARQQATLAGFAAQRHLLKADLVRTINKVQAYYPRIPRTDLELGKG